MNDEAFQEKLMIEYVKTSLYYFLSKNSTGSLQKTKCFITNDIFLKSLDYILQHPNSDIEKYYIKELLNIIMHNELSTVKVELQNICIPLEDTSEVIILDISNKDYSNANVFVCPIDEPLCIPKNRLFIEKPYLDLSEKIFDKKADFNSISLTSSVNMSTIENITIKSDIQILLDSIGHSMGWQEIVTEENKNEITNKFKQYLNHLTDEVVHLLARSIISNNSLTSTPVEINLDPGEIYLFLKLENHLIETFDKIEFHKEITGKNAIIIFQHPEPGMVQDKVLSLIKQYDSECFSNEVNIALLKGKENCVIIYN